MPEDGITLQADRWKVSASEKRSLGDYENTTVHTAIEGELPAPESELTDARRRQVREELLDVHRDLQKTTELAADNRIRELRDHEHWEDPVREEVDDV